MKPSRRNPLSARLIGAGLSSVIILSGSAGAAEIAFKTTATSTAEVTLASNWYGGVAPGSGDIAAWKTDGDPGTAGNQEARGGALTVSSPVSWLGFRHEDSSGALSLSGSPITLGTSGITEVRYEQLTINNNVVLGANQSWINGQTVTLNGDLTGAFALTKETGGSDLVFTGSTLGGGLVHIKSGRLVVNPATVGGTVTLQSLRTQRDVRLGNNGLVNIATGSLGLSTASGFWIQPSGTGSVGRLTSSSGTLNLATVDTNGTVTTGAFTTVDHQIKTPIVDFNGTTPVGITKTGVNNLTLEAASTFSGPVTINGGRLQINTASSLGSGTGTVTVASGAQILLNAGAAVHANNFSIAGTGVVEGTTSYGAIRFNNNTISGNVAIAAGGARIGSTTSGTISGALTGSGPLEINSSATGANGAVVLSGNTSGYTGTATISQGSLTISNNFGGSVINSTGATLIHNGTLTANYTHSVGTLQGTGTFVGNLTLNGATANDVLNVVPGALHVTGNLNLSGNTTVRASGLGGTVPVLYYTGSLSGGPANLTLENPTSFRGGTTFDTSTPGVVNLIINGAPITWTNGANDMNWNTTSLDWDNAGTPDTYHQSDLVTFGDTGAGTVNLVGVLTPSSITVDSSNNYTFAGTAGNVIGGNTGITKNGTGSLTLASSNTFLGALTLNGGTTTLPARQAYTGGTTVNNGAILDLTGGGGQGGTIRGTVNVNDTGILRITTGDATGWGTGPDRITALNLSNGGTLEVNNNANNQTLSNIAITLTGGNIVKGAAAAGHNGNIDLFNGSTSISSLASSTTSTIAYGVNLGMRQPVTTITTALGSTASGIDLQIDGSINSSPYDFTTPALVKNGPGTLCLNNPPATGIGTTSVYTGTTTINGGTLLVGTGGNTGIIGTGDIINNAALVFDRFDEVTLANTVSGTGTLEQRGSGTLVLTSGGTRSGDTLVSAGTLHMGATAFTASTFRVDAGATLSAGTPSTTGTATAPGLALNGGNLTYRISSDLSDKIIVTGSNGFSVNAPTEIVCTPSGSLQSGQTIQLIDYAGTIGGFGFGGLSLTVQGTNPHYSFTLVNNTTDTRVDASVTADTLIWQGNLSDVWDVETTSNWATTSNNSSSMYYDGDQVRFTDAGSGNPLVSLNGYIIPNSVEFDATIDYTLDGAGITGISSLWKKNSGTVTLINDNTYTGATTINAGTLQIGNGNTSGSLGTTAITNNATLAFNRSDAFTVGQSIAGSGQVVKRGTGTMTISGANTFSGPLVVETGTLMIGNAGALGTRDNGITVSPGASVNLNNVTTPAGETLTVSGNGVAGQAVTGAGALQGTLALTGNSTIGNANGTIHLGISTSPVPITGAHTLTKVGPSTVWHRAPADGLGNSLAALVVNEGLFGIEANNNGLSGVPITVNGSGLLSAWADFTRSLPTSQNNPITLNGGALGAGFAGITWTGPVTLTANSTLSTAAATENFTVAGVISGPFGLNKTQGSTVTLTAVNTYTGSTTVNTGTILLADNAGLKFVIGANGVNNKVTGLGTAIINGDFTVDLTGANLTNGNSWTLVDTSTKVFGSTFTLDGFTESADVHTKVVGNQTWTFTESTGTLTLTMALGFDTWLANYPSLPIDQRDPNDDYDADGFNNLLEYVLGGSPLVNDVASIAPAGVKDGLGNYVVTFKRSDLSEADTTQVLRYGTNLAGWTDIPIGASPGAGMVSIAENGAADDTVTVTIPTAGAPAFFVHLKVSKP